MARAVARGAAGHDLAALGDEILQGAHVLVVDLERLVGAKPAYFAPASAGPPAHPAPLASAAFARAIGVGARPPGREPRPCSWPPCPGPCSVLSSSAIFFLSNSTSNRCPDQAARLIKSLLSQSSVPMNSQVLWTRVRHDFAYLDCQNFDSPAAEDHARPRTARNVPVTLTAAPAAIRAPMSRASPPAITTPSLKPRGPRCSPLQSLQPVSRPAWFAPRARKPPCQPAQSCFGSPAGFASASASGRLPPDARTRPFARLQPHPPPPQA